MGKRKRKFTYAFSKMQLQITIEALLMARSNGAHCEVLLIEESGVEHKFDGISDDGGIDNLVDSLEASHTGYEIKLSPTGRLYTRSEDKSIETTINALNYSLGQLEEAETEEMDKLAAEAAPQVIADIYKFLSDEPTHG